MRTTFLVSSIVFLILSAQAFAFEGNGFKVLSKSIETSSHVTGGFIEKNISTKLMPTSTIAGAQAHDSQGHVNEIVRLWGSHSIALYNVGRTKQIYHYKYELNCDGQFTRETGQVELQPGANVRKIFDSYLNIKHVYSGTSRINVITEIIGEGPVTQTAIGTLKITDK